MCKCKKPLTYADYKKQKEKEGFFVSMELKDSDCVQCYFEKILGKHNEEDRDDLLNKRVKSRYNVDCQCGTYYPYSLIVNSHKEKGRLVAPMMPLTKCYNCYLLKKYGTLDRFEIGTRKKESMMQRLETTRKRLNSK